MLGNDLQHNLLWRKTVFKNYCTQNVQLFKQLGVLHDMVMYANIHPDFEAYHTFLLTSHFQGEL